MICIYTITNLVNGRIYIGSTVNFGRRKIEHLWGIENKNHPNKKILSDTKQFSPNDFLIEPISVFDNIDELWLRYIEAIWIDYFKYHWNLYNINLNTTGWGIQVKDFGSRKERLQFRKIAKVEKYKANEYVLSKLKSEIIVQHDEYESPF